MNIDSNDEFKEVYIKSHACYHFVKLINSNETKTKSY